MEKIKDLQYYKENAEENYLTTPISVLRYITELEHALQLQQGGVSGSVCLQVGMRVKIKDDKISFPRHYGHIKTITKRLKDYKGEKSFELDNEEGDIWIIEDFQYCIEYPSLVMR